MRAHARDGVDTTTTTVEEYLASKCVSGDYLPSHTGVRSDAGQEQTALMLLHCCFVLFFIYYLFICSQINDFVFS